MGNLPTAVKELFASPMPPTLVFLGLSNSGKTTILRQLTANIEQLSLGLPLHEPEIAVTPEARLVAWSVCGRQSLLYLMMHYFEDADYLLYVVDSSEPTKFPEVETNLFNVLKHYPPSIPLLVLANKRDLPDALPASQVADCLHLSAIKDRKWGCIELQGNVQSDVLKLMHVINHQSP